MRASFVANELKKNIDSVVKELLPAGKIQGREWCVGNLNGDAGESLKVCLKGGKAGVWEDFATGEKGGDLLNLWMAVRKVSLPVAIEQAASFLGLTEYKPDIKPRKYKTPLKPKSMVVIEKAPKALKYLQGRGLTLETLKLFNICGDYEKIYFPFIHGKKASMIKRLKIERVGDKKDCKVTSDGQMQCLMGWQTVSETTREIIIREGEINAMSIKQAGHDALSVPLGGGGGHKQSWVENEYDRLERFDTIYLWFDDDKSGHEAIEALIPRLGAERCKIIMTPTDSNDMLCAGELDYDTIQRLKEKGKDAAPPSFMRMTDELFEEVWHEIKNPTAYANGYKLPWGKCGSKFVFRAGEVTALTGYNSHGKTVALSQMVVGIIKQGGYACVASLESRPKKWIAVMIKQYAHMTKQKVKLTKKELRELWDDFDHHLFSYATPGRGKCKEILDVFRYSRKRYGADFFVIDNLSAVDVSLEDYDAQRDFVQSLVNFAKEENVHVVFVAHQRKPLNDMERGGRYEIKGSSSLSDLADNVIVWWRNKKKEQEKRDNGKVNYEDPDAIMVVDKQRETGEEPQFKFWFHREFNSFFDVPNIYAEENKREREPIDEWDKL